MNTDRLFGETSPVHVPRDSFDWFWNAYPRRVGKGGRGGAEGAFTRALRIADYATIMEGLRGWCSHWSRSNTELRFIPYPATWLNQRRWEDVPVVRDAQTAWSKALATARQLDAGQ